MNKESDSTPSHPTQSDPITKDETVEEVPDEKLIIDLIKSNSKLGNMRMFLYAGKIKQNYYYVWYDLVCKEAKETNTFVCHVYTEGLGASYCIILASPNYNHMEYTLRISSDVHYRDSMDNFDKNSSSLIQWYSEVVNTLKSKGMIEKLFDWLKSEDPNLIESPQSWDELQDLARKQFNKLNTSESLKVYKMVVSIKCLDSNKITRKKED